MTNWLDSAIDWNVHGVTPPIYPGEQGNSNFRSPYYFKLIDFIKCYSYTPERLEIIKGLVAFRQRIYASGIRDGFQWVNGSFAENVELLRGRPPNDIDVVTYANVQSSITLSGLSVEDWLNENGEIVDNPSMKKQFNVDSYMFELGGPFDISTAQICTYWYSMWSHQKETDLWKGFFCIPLSTEEDAHAVAYLEGLSE